MANQTQEELISLFDRWLSSKGAVMRSLNNRKVITERLRIRVDKSNQDAISLDDFEAVFQEAQQDGSFDNPISVEQAQAIIDAEHEKANRRNAELQRRDRGGSVIVDSEGKVIKGHLTEEERNVREEEARRAAQKEYNEVSAQIRFVAAHDEFRPHDENFKRVVAQARKNGNSESLEGMEEAYTQIKSQLNFGEAETISDAKNALAAILSSVTVNTATRETKKDLVVWIRDTKSATQVRRSHPDLAAKMDRIIAKNYEDDI